MKHSLMNTLLNRKNIAILMTAIFVISMAGCGSNAKSSTRAEYAKEAPAEAYDLYSTSAAGSTAYDAYAEEAFEVEEEAAYEDNGSASVTVDERSSQRKLIRNMDLSVETEDYDTMLRSVTDKIEQLGGYIERMNSYNENSIGSRSCYLNIRIPQAKLNEFVSTMEDVSNVTHRMEYVEDVTLNYVDLESHKRMLQEEQERLLELLSKAETVEDMIAIDARLTDVRYSLESMEQQLRSIDNRVEYSTVNLDISETSHYTPVVKKTPFDRIRIGLKETVYGIGTFFVDLFVNFVVALPVLVLLAAFIAIIVLIVRRCIRKYKKRQSSKAQKYYAQTPGMQTPQSAQASATAPVIPAQTSDPAAEQNKDLNEDKK